MIYALKRVKEEFRFEIEKYDLIVDPATHAVGYKDAVSILEPYSSTRVCRQMLKHYLRLAKAEAQQKTNENQSTLF